MVPMSIGCSAAQLVPQMAQQTDLPGQVAPAGALGQPAVAERCRAPDGRRRRAADPDGRAWGLHRARPQAEVAGRPARAGQLGELVGEASGQRGDRLVGVAAPRREITGDRLVLLGDVAGAYADDDAAAREQIDGRELFGRPQRVSLCQHQDVGEQTRPRGQSRQPGQRGGRVVPGRAHGVGQTPRDGRVVADADVEAARVVGGTGHRGQLVGPRLRLPLRRVERRLGLDRQLHAPDDAAVGDGAHDVGGNEGGVGHGRRSCRVSVDVAGQAVAARAIACSHGVPKVVHRTRDRLRCRCSGTSQVKPMPPYT